MTYWNVNSVRMPGRRSSGGASASSREPRVQIQPRRTTVWGVSPAWVSNASASLSVNQRRCVASKIPSALRGHDPRARLRVGAPVSDVGQADDHGGARFEQVRVAAQRGPGVDEVLEDVGRDQDVEAAVGPGRLDVAGQDVVQPCRGLARVLGLALDTDDLDRPPLLERGARGAGRAAEVEHPPRVARHVLEDLGSRPLVGGRTGRALSGPHWAGIVESPAMAGHSKWAGIKHKKAIVDARRGKLFTKLARAITVAAKEGGGDLEGNPALGLAVQKAKDASMPKDNIERAIAKGTGAGADTEAFEAVMYEGYGPGGVAILVEALTDNRNRTGSEIRHAFNKHGGNLGEPGSVAYLFDKKGVAIVDGEHYSEDDLMPAVDAGAEDIVLDEDVFEVICEPADLTAVRAALVEAGIEVAEAQVMQRPKTLVPLDEDGATKLMKLIDTLEELDDTDAVHANFDVDAEILERVAG